MFRTCVVLVIVFVIHLSASPLDPLHYTKGFQLNSFIRHYEPAHYDQSQLDSQHNRVRRSLTQKQDVRLEIRGHGRTFRLRLTPDREVFSEDVSFESTKGPLSVDPKMVYAGTLEVILNLTKVVYMRSLELQCSFFCDRNVLNTTIRIVLNTTVDNGGAERCSDETAKRSLRSSRGKGACDMGESETDVDGWVLCIVSSGTNTIHDAPSSTGRETGKGNVFWTTSPYDGGHSRSSRTDRR
ncbi:hypothetical protein RI129_000347 [Pyrocoelia pectoralis]|uniref:Peptidase M12B propeptide domain-containing protein n=1 Tax=Pyrocoelia pectoralis TaxID=417401 RepID=A0AAN7VU11_9COLE